jgi:hypothetical protein
MRRSVILGGTLFVLWGSQGVYDKAESAVTRSELPVRVVKADLSGEPDDKFYSQLRKFADLNAFAVRIAPTTPDGRNVLVQMWREDIKIIGANPHNPNHFEFAFYDNDSISPSGEAFDALVTSLFQVLREIKGVTYSEEFR